MPSWIHVALVPSPPLTSWSPSPLVTIAPHFEFCSSGTRRMSFLRTKGSLGGHSRSIRSRASLILIWGTNSSLGPFLRIITWTRFPIVVGGSPQGGQSTAWRVILLSLGLVYQCHLIILFSALTTRRRFLTFESRVFFRLAYSAESLPCLTNCICIASTLTNTQPPL